MEWIKVKEAVPEEGEWALFLEEREGLFGTKTFHFEIDRIKYGRFSHPREGNIVAWTKIPEYEGVSIQSYNEQVDQYVCKKIQEEYKESENVPWGETGQFKPKLPKIKPSPNKISAQELGEFLLGPKSF